MIPGEFPSYAKLICRHPYGRPSRNYEFSGEVVFDHILIHIYQAGYSCDADVDTLRGIHPLYNHLYQVMQKAAHTDVTSLT